MSADQLIQREILKELRDHLTAKEITLITGPRQAGKTTLMRILERECRQQGNGTVFLNLDSQEDARFFVSQRALIDKLRLEFGSGRGYAFIDEIQRKNDASIFLKGIYDQDLPYKLIVSGSGSIELKENVHESLAGRKLMFEVLPLSFSELANFRTGYRYADRLADFYVVDRAATAAILEEYLQFGGYPRVVLEDTREQKMRQIDEIFRSYIERDISALLRVEKLDAFRMLVEILASQNSQILSYAELSATLGLSTETVHNYLWYLEHTFITRRLTPFFRNKRKEITKAPTVYFTDLGLRNFALGRFGVPLRPAERGFVFQNLVYLLLMHALRHTGTRLYFWRTKDGAEVDFVLIHREEVIPIEVKYHAPVGKDGSFSVGRSLRACIKRYHPPQAFIMTSDGHGETMVENTPVHIRPFTDISLLLFG